MIDAAVLRDIRDRLAAAHRSVEIEDNARFAAARQHRGSMLEGRSTAARAHTLRVLDHLNRAMFQLDDAIEALTPQEARS